MSSASESQVLGPQNPRIAELRRLIGRRSSRSVDIVLEGPRTVEEALVLGYVPTTVIVPESGAGHPLLRDMPRATEVIVTRDNAFARLAPSVSPQPMLALVPRPEAEIPTAFRATDTALVLADVSDPGNVGTLIRVADAVGAAVVVSIGGADPWGSKAVRSSAGSVLRVPVVAYDTLEVAVGDLRAAGARVIGTDVREGEPHDEGVLNGPVAIVLGSEPHGLDRSIDPLIDAWVRIDMPGNTESLNVAMAGTLLAYEASKPVS
ncbi:MAG: TrmH family RNA methyltransferase [Candidatus Aldehydirespiratoraceae bacterium]|jgi:TrmH family RNA methyltransferase